MSRGVAACLAPCLSTLDRRRSVVGQFSSRPQSEQHSLATAGIRHRSTIGLAAGFAPLVLVGRPPTPAASGRRQRRGAHHWAFAHGARRTEWPSASPRVLGGAQDRCASSWLVPTAERAAAAPVRPRRTVPALANVQMASPPSRRSASRCGLDAQAPPHASPQPMPSVARIVARPLRPRRDSMRASLSALPPRSNAALVGHSLPHGASAAREPGSPAPGAEAGGRQLRPTAATHRCTASGIALMPHVWRACTWTRALPDQTSHIFKTCPPNIFHFRSNFKFSNFSTSIQFPKFSKFQKFAHNFQQFHNFPNFRCSGQLMRSFGSALSMLLTSRPMRSPRPPPAAEPGAPGCAVVELGLPWSHQVPSATPPRPPRAPARAPRLTQASPAAMRPCVAALALALDLGLQPLRAQSPRSNLGTGPPFQWNPSRQ